MNENREPASWPWFISLAGCCTVAGYFWAHADYVTALTVIALSLSALAGYSMMASRLLCLDCGLVAAALLTALLGLFCRPTLTAWFGTSGSVLIVMVAAVVVAFAVTMALRRLIVEHCPERPSLEALNRCAGLGIGAGQGAVLCALVLGGLLVLEPIAKDRMAADVQGQDHKIARVLTAKVLEYAEQTRQSAIGPSVAEYNLFRQWSPLEQLSDDLRVLRHPLTRTPSQTERAIDEQFSAR